MPNFGTPFSGNTSDRKLTNEELIRAIRLMIASEYEAVQLYTQLAESIDDDMSIKVLMSIADEEKVHAGEFLKLLFYLSPDEKKFYDKGEKEVGDIIITHKATSPHLKKEEVVVDYDTVFSKLLIEWNIDSTSVLSQVKRKEFFNSVSARLEEEKRKIGETEE